MGRCRVSFKYLSSFNAQLLVDRFDFENPPLLIFVALTIKVPPSCPLQIIENRNKTVVSRMTRLDFIHRITPLWW
jgi:hypothetical protein